MLYTCTYREKRITVASIKEELLAKGMAVPPDKPAGEHFDSNCITPVSTKKFYFVCYPASTTDRPNVGLILVQRHRWWANIKSTLGYLFLFAEQLFNIQLQHISRKHFITI